MNEKISNWPRSNSLNKRQNILKQILSQRKLPEDPLDDLTIRYFLQTFALMDSNNFHQKTGVGQRQSRIFSNLVKQRHYHMGHGIGRSGDIMANQPKAAGSSLLLQLTRFFVVSALKQLNYEFVQDVLLLPLATGMSLSLAFLVLAQMHPEKKYVIWSRIDQKTCLKSIGTANLKPIVIELIQGQQKISYDINQKQGKLIQSEQNHSVKFKDSLHCDHQAIQKKIEELGAENVLCIVSTTSCFAPRIPDDVQINSEIAKKYKILHVVNNAYGIWCSKIAHKIKEGMKKGQCTIVVQSTDKNFMVPVGGSFIFTNEQKILQKISSKYPGRANASPIVDMFITLLTMGKKTIKNLQKQRKQNFQYMKQKATVFAKKYGCRILQAPGNTISMAMNISGLQLEDPTQLGSILYSKRVMGHRIIRDDKNLTKIIGIQFKNYGSHHNCYKGLPYINFATAVGTTKAQLDAFFERLQKSIKQLKKKEQKKRKTLLLTKQTQKIEQKVEEIGQLIVESEQKFEAVELMIEQQSQNEE